MTEPLYAIIFPFQKAQITAWCWGACGFGQIGAIDIGPTAAIICQEVECPHLDRQMDESMGEVDGRPVFMRKLKEVDDD